MKKRDIQAIVEDSFTVPESVTPDDLAPQLLKLLGSTDASVRENTMEILWHWGQAGVFSDEALIEIGRQAAANLLIGLGEQGTDSVFLRAFSALVLRMVVDAEQRFGFGLAEGRARFLEPHQVLAWYESALQCFGGEMDHRGFTEHAGWAHSLAHLSDALCSFARSEHLDQRQLQAFLDVVADTLIRPAPTEFEFGEDTRLAHAVYHVLLRNLLDEAFLHAWVLRLAHTPAGENWGSVFGLEHCDRNGVRARLNVNVFLRSLYFLLRLGLRSRIEPDRAPNVYEAFYENPIAVRGALMAFLVEGLRLMNRPLYKDPD